ncbi:MAG: hypothetical protein IKU13_07340 [Clostridia bacterium]|nr:hypothetical protein [Clostridia bacterium]
MKKILAMLMAVIMLLGCAGCGKKGLVLLEYEPVSHKTYEMPETLESMDDFRASWKHIISSAFEKGASYNGEPLGAMTIEYFKEKLKEAGHETGGIVSNSFNGGGDDYLIIGYAESKENPKLSGVTLSVSDVSESDFDRGIFERLNKEMNIYGSADFLGKDVYELVEYLGATEELITPVMNSTDGMYYWYGENGEFWSISAEWDEGDEYNKPSFTLHFARTENKHRQSVTIKTENETVCSVTCSENVGDPNSGISTVEYEKQVADEALIQGHWYATQMEIAEGVVAEYEDGAVIPIDKKDVIYADFAPDGSGTMKLSEEETAVCWRKLETEEKDVVVFEVFTGFEVETQSIFYFTYKGENVETVLTDSDNTYSFSFVKES